MEQSIMETILFNQEDIRKLIREELKKIIPLKEFKRGEEDVDSIIRSNNKVVAVLSGHKSGYATKLGKEYDEISQAAKELGKQKKAMSSKIKKYIRDNLNEYAESENILIQRVIETNSVVLQVTKQTERSKTQFDVDGFFEDMLKLVPDLSDKLEELKDKHTTIKKSVSKGRIGVKIKEHNLNEADVKELIKKITNKLKSIFKSFYNKIKKWSGRYDKQLKRIKEKYGA